MITMTMKLQSRWLLVLVTMAAMICAGALSSYAADPAEAQTEYQSFCTPCHGATGKGDGPAGANLSVKPRDFSDCAAMSKLSDDTLFEAIKSGGNAIGKSGQMPPWGGAFSDAQIHALVAYLRSFCKK